ncbi:MAG: hypothetical protein AB7L84_09845 [Acidimicrobiia bacterium]
MLQRHIAGNHVTEQPIAATTAAGTNTNAIFRAPFRCTITGIYMLPTAAATGHTTDNATVTALNKGAAGAGTTEVASLALANGVDLAAFDQKDVTLSTTAASLNLAEGDVLSFAIAKGGTGLATPAMTVGVLYKAR